MFELQGKYGTAKVFTDVVEQSAIAQVISLLNQPYVEGSQVRMMPDNWGHNDHQRPSVPQPGRCRYWLRNGDCQAAGGSH